LSIRCTRVHCHRLRTRGTPPEPKHHLLTRMLAIMACAAIVTVACATSLAIFWRAFRTPTILDALFVTWTDVRLIMLGGALQLAAAVAVHLVRRITG
jgi:hypothetical protein